MSTLLTADGFYHILRWVHFMAGIAWIGLLYYFNFVQGPFFAETDGATKQTAVRQLVPRALWWFRWSAAITFFVGVVMLWHRGHVASHYIYLSSWGLWILIGSLLGTLMAFNVWFVIWPAQKVVIASANSVASGGQPDPRAAARAERALVASRTNVLFSIPMLFFMGAASHLPLALTETSDRRMIWAIVGAILIALELNALKGKVGPMKTISGVIASGFALWLVLYLSVTCFV